MEELYEFASQLLYLIFQIITLFSIDAIAQVYY